MINAATSVTPIPFSRLWQYEIISWSNAYHYLPCKNKVGKVATAITSKGYCSTKNMYYFGLKLHAVAFRREGTILFQKCSYFPLLMKMTPQYSKENVWEIWTIEKYMPIKYIRIYHSIKRTQESKKTRTIYSCKSHQRRITWNNKKGESGKRLVFNGNL